MKSLEFAIGDFVELADKETGFTDSVTGFDISRDQTKELTDPIGNRTNQAIMSGCLLIVGRSKPSGLIAGGGEGGSGDEFDLPEDLPGRETFVAAGITTFAGVQELDTDEKLLAITGIGPGTVKKLAAWNEANAKAAATDAK